jgi:hypothetical protein
MLFRLFNPTGKTCIVCYCMFRVGSDRGSCTVALSSEREKIMEDSGEAMSEKRRLRLKRTFQDGHFATFFLSRRLLSASERARTTCAIYCAGLALKCSKG